jgi:hypothetical protein
VEIRKQPEVIDPEFGQPKKAGTPVLYDESGKDYFLWVDSGGRLRVSPFDPGANDLSGAVVGTQT